MHRRLRRALVGSAAIAVLAAGAIAPAAPAQAATAINVTLAVASDDTAAFVSDGSTTNGIVPANGGRVTYQWGWLNGSGTSIDVQQTLPSTMAWDAGSVSAGCSVVASVTLKCTISGLTPNAVGSVLKTAVVWGAPNGAVLSSTLVSGSGTPTQVTSASVAVTVAAKPPVLSLSYQSTPIRASNSPDPNPASTAVGQRLTFHFYLTVDSGGVDGTKGYESIPGTFPVAFTFNQTGGTLEPCGTITCTMSGDTVTVEVPAALPYQTAQHPWPNKTMLSAFNVGMWYPDSMFIPNPSTLVGASWPAGGVSTLSGQTATYPAGTLSITVPNSSTPLMGGILTPLPPIYPGGDFVLGFRLTPPLGVGTGITTGLSTCQVWDPALFTLQDRAMLVGFTYEFGTATYPDEAARQNADCGHVGDGAAGWYSTQSAARSAGVISAVRIVETRAVSITEEGAVYFTASSDAAGGTTGGLYASYWSDAVPRTHGTFSLSSGLTTNAYGARLTFANAMVRISTVPPGTVGRGGTLSVTVKPTVGSAQATITGRIAVSPRVVTTLPDACFTFVPGPLAPTSVVPAVPATPTGSQTCMSLPGQVITWDLPDQSADAGHSVDPITFRLNADAAMPVPFSRTITSVISSTSDTAPAATRTSTATFATTAINQLLLTTTSTVSSILTGRPVPYRLTWLNGTTTVLGPSWVVDLLPNDSDGRGSSGVGGLAVSPVVTGPAGLQVQYTTDDVAATLRPALTSDPTGSNGITWVSTPPATAATAIRVYVPTLAIGASGTADFTVTGAMTSASTLVNSATLRPIASTTTVPSLNLLLAGAATTLSGIDRLDADRSGSVSAADTPRAGDVITLSGYEFGQDGLDQSGLGDDLPVSGTRTTASDGGFSFTVNPGRYSLQNSATGLTVVLAPPAVMVVAAGTPVVADYLFQPPPGAPIPPTTPPTSTTAAVAMLAFTGASAAAALLFASGLVLLGLIIRMRGRRRSSHRR